jgi:hypothetical protein
MHGHVHLFEAMGFQSAHPTTLVLGNSGSANEGLAPASLPPGAQPYPGALVEDYMSRSEYGFATLDRQAHGAWLLTEHTPQGVPVIECKLAGGKSQCSKLQAVTR